MAIRLVGELLSPISCPMADVTIHLKALDTSAAVLSSSEASVKTDYKGRYDFVVPVGLYLVSLDNGISSAELGQVQVYSDSTESTLQALLDAPQTEPSPVWLQQLEEKVAEATKQAANAAQSAEQAADTAKTVTETADSAKQHADRAYASSTSAAQSKTDAEDAAKRAAQSASQVPEIAQNAIDAINSSVEESEEKVTTTANSAVEKIKGVANKTNINVSDAVTAAKEAESSAITAKKEADRAKSEADRASQITGLDTVDEAVADAMSRSYQYAMSKVEFDALREQRKSEFAGSGFLEWGASSEHSADTNINQGMVVRDNPPSVSVNTLRLGRETNGVPKGVSKTRYPIVLVDGVVLSVKGAFDEFQIPLPSAPSGTKVYDSASGQVIDYTKDVDPKYGDVALTHSEAISRTFEGLVKNGDFRHGDDGSWGSNDSAGMSYGVQDGKMVITGQSPEDYAIGRKGCLQYINVVPNLKYALEITDFTAEATTDAFVRVTPEATWESLAEKNIGSNSSVKNLILEFTPTTDRIKLCMDINFSKDYVSTMRVGALSIRPVTQSVITSRSDLVFLETWHEDVGEKSIICPLGNVQYGATEWNGITLKKLTELGVAQGYSAFGEWDSETVGYGVRLSDLTDAQLQQFLSEPSNNIYFDSEAKKLIQCRYRVRVVEGVNNSPYSVTPDENNKVDAMTWHGENLRIARQDGRTVASDFNRSIYYLLNAHPSSPTYNREKCLFSFRQEHGVSSALPICLVQRLNQGAKSEEFNSFGCDLFLDAKPWHSTSEQIHSQKDCFTKALHTDPQFANSGSIASGQSGRPSNDIYKYHDAVYSGQVHDLRLSARKQDVNLLRENAIRAAVSGEMRGRGKVPFTKVFDTAAAATAEGFTNQVAVNGKFVCHKWLTAEFDEIPWVDLIGSPEHIRAAFPNGVAAMWAGQVTENSSLADIKLNRKSTTLTKNLTVRVMKDGSCVAADNTPFNSIDAVTNKPQGDFVNGMLRDEVILYHYTTLAKFTKSANSSNIIGDVGDVFASNSFEIGEGGRLIHSTLSTITKNGGKQKRGFVNVTQCDVIDSKIHTAGHGFDLKHNPVPFAHSPDNLDGGKMLPTITEKDGLLYLQLHGCELKFNGKSPINVVGSTNTDTVPLGSIFILRDCQAVAGYYLNVGDNGSNTFDTFVRDGHCIINSDGDYVNVNGQLIWKRIHGTGTWSDDNKIPVISGEGTKTDLSGNVVKTFCHHSMFPLGIADSSSSAIASRQHDNKANISDGINSGLHFDNLDSVPEPIREFYYEVDVILEERWIEEITQDEEGNDVINRIPDHTMGIHVHKYPAPYEHGGHISQDSIAAWQFHDDFKDWLQECARIKFEASQQEGVEVERIPLPPMPLREDY